MLKIKAAGAFLLAVLVISGCGADTILTAEAAAPTAITIGAQLQRGFLNDNVYHSDLGDIHYSSYIPESYDGSEPYALFITLPGWEGLYFQGVGANMAEDFDPEAIRYNDRMIVLSPQLNDWGETSANEAIALTEYFLEHYNIDRTRVYLHGMSGGGETGSLVMGKRPDLYAAYLMTSSQWDGDLDVLAEARTPVYMAIGENDSYYGSDSLKQSYAGLRKRYEAQRLTKTAWVYLPYGYSAEQKYNVMYLSHGGWSDETTLMGTPEAPHAFKHIMDHAIEDGKIQPLIIVLPTYNNTSPSDSGSYSLALRLVDNFHNELLNDLIPAVESKYSTFVESTDFSVF